MKKLFITSLFILCCTQYTFAGIGGPVSPVSKSESEIDVHKIKIKAVLSEEIIVKRIREAGLYVREIKKQLDSLSDEEILTLSEAMEDGGTSASGAVFLLLTLMLGMALIAMLILYMLEDVMYDPHY